VHVQRLRLQVREERANAKAFRTILVNSLFSAESVARAYGLPSRVCYLGVDPALWDIGPREPERLAVGIGEFGPHKGIDFVLRALALSDRPCPELHWVGNRANPDYLKRLCMQAESLHVAFTPHVAVPQAELTALLRRAAFLVYAPHLEPFGYAPLECAAAGLPTIAVAEGGIRETVENNVTGLLVAREVDAMAAAINMLIGDSQQAALLGKAARQAAYSRWAVEDAVTRLETELEQALATSLRATEVVTNG
jgi:glycosyltransferase involved in cell wall biosynthesis